MKLSATLKLAGSVATLLGVLWMGMLAADNRWARSAEVKEQFKAVQEELQDARLDALYRDKADCDRQARPSVPESGFCQRVRKQIKALEEKK